MEDDEVNLMIAEHILGKEGYVVSSVNNGEEAIDIISREAFDLVLMDIEMPIMDGLEATPIIRQMTNGQHVPIIALTAHSVPEKIEEFQHAGLDDHIIKPFDGAKFKVISDKYLNGK